MKTIYSRSLQLCLFGLMLPIYGAETIRETSVIQKFQVNAATMVVVKMKSILDTLAKADADEAKGLTAGTKVAKETYEVVAVQNRVESSLGTYVYIFPAGVGQWHMPFEVDNVRMDGSDLWFIYRLDQSVYVVRTKMQADNQYQRIGETILSENGAPASFHTSKDGHLQIVVRVSNKTSELFEQNKAGIFKKQDNS